MTLLMLKGLPASGKSTYAKSLARLGHWKRVNKDDLRAMIDDSKWSKTNEKAVLAVRDKLVDSFLYNGYNVVVDDTNFAPVHEQTLRAIAESHGAKFEVEFIDTPLVECLERDAKRANGVGADVIRKMYREYLEEKPKPIVQDTNLPRAIIVDIDGTLAHMKNRSPYDYSKVSEDTVDDTIADLVLMLRGERYSVIVMSGRPDSCREATEQWLADNGIPYDMLLMRAASDSRNDAIVKREIFDANIRDKFFVELVLDDRNRVVDMWRALGLKCLQVAPGDF